MEILFILALGAVALVVLPLLLLKLVVFLVLLPFKLIGLALKIVFGVVSVIGSVLMAVAGAVFGVVALAFFVLLLPLLPLVLIGGLVWLLVRASRPPSTAIRIAG